jgi:hypothetical protein
MNQPAADDADDWTVENISDAVYYVVSRHKELYWPTDKQCLSITKEERRRVLKLHRAYPELEALGIEMVALGMREIAIH